jgi:hypothetical protein
MAGESQRTSVDKAAFRRFLQWLGEGAGSDGEAYLTMHRRLVSYFDRKDCAFPQELADETLNRVARRLQEEGSLTGPSPARYCYIVARFVLLEYRRQARPADIDFHDPVGSHVQIQSATLSGNQLTLSGFITESRNASLVGQPVRIDGTLEGASVEQLTVTIGGAIFNGAGQVSKTLTPPSPFVPVPFPNVGGAP